MKDGLENIYDPDRHFGCRVNDKVTWHGFNAMILQNEKIQVVLLVDKGTEIVQFLYKPTDMDFIWHARNPLRDAGKFNPVSGDEASPFYDRWSGGWFEILPNNGPAASYKGARLGFYAETINLPWEYQIIEDTPKKVKVFFWVKTFRMPFILKKWITIESGKSAIQIEEEVINIGGEDLAFAWGHHPVVGPPFLSSSCIISSPDCKVIVGEDEDGPGFRMGLNQEGRWPIIKDVDGDDLDLRRVEPQSARSMDNCYLTDYKNDAFIAVTNPDMQVGFGFSWDHSMFRYLWLWQAFGGGVGYPWFSDSYQMGIEPWSSYPCAGLEAAIENKTALSLKPGESKKVWLTAVAFEGTGEVKRISKNGKVSFKL